MFFTPAINHLGSRFGCLFRSLGIAWPCEGNPVAGSPHFVCENTGCWGQKKSPVAYLISTWIIDDYIDYR